MDNTNEQKKEHQQLSETLHSPLAPFLDRYRELDLGKLTVGQPNIYKAVIALAVVAGVSHGVMAWAKATWIAYVSFDLLSISFVVLMLLCDRYQSHDFKREEKGSP